MMDAERERGRKTAVKAARRATRVYEVDRDAGTDNYGRCYGHFS